MHYTPERKPAVADIQHPGSLSRLPLVSREDLDEKGKRAYDDCADSSKRLHTKLEGPPGFWLHIPDLLGHVREVNWHLRNSDIGLERHLRELTILVTARENNSQYEWTAHETHALKAGLAPGIIDCVRQRGSIANQPAKESVIIAFGRELFRHKKVSAETYLAALDALGQQGVVHMIALMSNYAMTAVIFHGIDQRLASGDTPLLPLP